MTQVSRGLKILPGLKEYSGGSVGLELVMDETAMPTNCTVKRRNANRLYTRLSETFCYKYISYTHIHRWEVTSTISLCGKDRQHSQIMAWAMKHEIIKTSYLPGPKDDRYVFAVFIVAPTVNVGVVVTVIAQEKKVDCPWHIKIKLSLFFRYCRY